MFRTEENIKAEENILALTDLPKWGAAPPKPPGRASRPFLPNPVTLPN